MDGGAGWYAYSDYVVNDAGSFLSSHYLYGDKVLTKQSDGYSIAVFSVYTSDQMFIRPLLISTVADNACIYLNGSSVFAPSSSVSYGGFTWYYSSQQGFNVPLGTDYSTSLVVVDRDSQSIDNGDVLDVLNKAGVTSDSSVLVPPAPAKTHVLQSFNNAPASVTYRNGGFNQETTNVTFYNNYTLANDYNNVLLSVDGLGSRNGFYVGPSSDKATFQYVAYRPYQVDSSEYSTLAVEGTYKLTVGATMFTEIKPYSMSLYVNGYRLGSDGISYDSSTGVLSVNQTVDLTAYGDIETIGVWASYNGSISGTASANPTDVFFYLNDALTLTPGGIAGESTSTENIDNNTWNVFSVIRDTFQWLLDLPSMLGNLLMSLFVPSESDMLELKEKFQDLLQGRLGFIWQAGDWVVSFFGDLVTSLTSYEDYSFTFPGISFPMNGETVSILDRQTVSLENDFMNVVRPVLGTIVTIVSVLAFVNMAEEMVIAITSGTSYFAFLRRREEG